MNIESDGEISLWTWSHRDWGKGEKDLSGEKKFDAETTINSYRDEKIHKLIAKLHCRTNFPTNRANVQCRHGFSEEFHWSVEFRWWNLSFVVWVTDLSERSRVSRFECSTKQSWLLPVQEKSHFDNEDKQGNMTNETIPIEMFQDPHWSIMIGDRCSRLNLFNERWKSSAGLFTSFTWNFSRIRCWSSSNMENRSIDRSIGTRDFSQNDENFIFTLFVLFLCTWTWRDTMDFSVLPWSSFHWDWIIKS